MLSEIIAITITLFAHKTYDKPNTMNKRRSMSRTHKSAKTQRELLQQPQSI